MVSNLCASSDDALYLYAESVSVLLSGRQKYKGGIIP